MSAKNELTGPFIKAAVFCENILQEADNVLSAIRIFDRSAAEIDISGGEEIAEPPVVIAGSLLVALVAGKAIRTQAVEVKLVKPSGSISPLGTFPIEFTADEDASVQLVLRLTLVLAEVGIHWFEIFLGEVLMSRIPLRITKTVTRRS